LKEKGNRLRHLAVGVGVVLIAFPEPVTTFAGALLVAWALRPRLSRLFCKLGACRCDYHHYGPCQEQGFPYLQVWSGIPAPVRVSAAPVRRGTGTGLWQLSGSRTREKWNRTITYRGEPHY